MIDLHIVSSLTCQLLITERIDFQLFCIYCIKDTLVCCFKIYNNRFLFTVNYNVFHHVNTSIYRNSITHIYFNVRLSQTNIIKSRLISVYIFLYRTFRTIDHTFFLFLGSIREIEYFIEKLFYKFICDWLAFNRSEIDVTNHFVKCVTISHKFCKWLYKAVEHRQLESIWAFKIIFEK